MPVGRVPVDCPEELPPVVLPAYKVKSSLGASRIPNIQSQENTYTSRLPTVPASRLPPTGMPVNPVLSTPRLTGLPVMRAPAYRVPSVYLETGEDVIEHADDLLSSQPAPLQDQDWKDLEKITGTSLIVPGGSAAVPSAPKNPPPPSDMMRFRSQRAAPQILKVYNGLRVSPRCQ